MPLNSESRAIRMVMTDVDGTLVTPEKDLTEQAKNAVSQIHAAGLKFTLISSRPPYGMRSLVDELGVKIPIVAFNGGMLVTSDGQPMQSFRLRAELIPEILDCLSRFGLAPRLYTPEQWLIPTLEHRHLQHEICTIEAEPIVAEDFTPYFQQVYKITGVSDDVDAVDACLKALQKTAAGQYLSVLCSQAYYLDITDVMANKGHAVTLMAENQGMLSNEVAVIGDMPSDVPMFHAAGFSIAMGNASDTVKREATICTDSNTDEGFAKAMERYILQTNRIVMGSA